MAYIKSHSNYVIKDKHQLTNDGTILERDIATIGGLNKFALGQTPIYASGNFIITINNEGTSTKNYGSENVFEEWTLNDINNSAVKNDINTNEIVLKKDFYSLKDFAYYGSCSELIRASITDIIRRFPGELYSPIINGGGINIYYKSNGKTQILGNENLFLVDNPFNIQLHVEDVNLSDIEDKLKYLCKDLYTNYQLFIGDSETPIEITSITRETHNNDRLCAGDLISTITINDTIVIYAYNANYGNIVYLTTQNNLGLHIRPKEEFYNQFFKSLDSFQSVLLNRKTTPKYTATFEVISENSFGYETKIKKFTFPRTYGEYNLAPSNATFSSYLDELVKISQFYDEVFCDNLFRNMTHESIKNFDWSYTKYYNEEEEEENIVGGTKIQKFIRLMGREFDEIKFYIDGISNANSISYDDKNNLADYFLTDTLNNDGWEIKNIHPSKNCNHIHSETIKPYSYKDGDETNNYFLLGKGCGKYEFKESDSNRREKVDELGVLRNRISHYVNNKEYTINEINNHFMKILKLNSRNILRHKSTIEGIEMVLGLFGLKSKNYVNNLLSKNNRYNAHKTNMLTDSSYDYEIKEYTTFAKPIIDTKNSNYRYDWYNRTKTVGLSGNYEPYQGLMVRCSNVYTDGDRYLYPYFSPNEKYDGNPYYQMNGGWLKNDGIHTETIRNIKSVDTIYDLLKIKYSELNGGDVYYVNALDTNILIIEGIIYNIENEYIMGEVYNYISVNVFNNSLKIGQKEFYDYINVSNYDGTIKTYSLNDLYDNYEIRIYFSYDNEGKLVFTCNQNSWYGIDDIIDFGHNGDTNYFQIINKNKKNEISNDGWKQIKATDDIFDIINKITNKFTGNNPHKGNFRYDDGSEYLRYFSQIFKYALQDESFDKRQYGRNGIPSLYDSIDDISSIGFKNIIKPNDPCEYNIYQDKKLHHFCDYVTSNGEEMIYDDNDVVENVNNTLFAKDEYKNLSGETNSGNVDQIINTKRVDIIFNTNNEETKCYINDVVLEYLTQVIPSNVILEIKYEESQNYVEFDYLYDPNIKSYRVEYFSKDDPNNHQCNAINGEMWFVRDPNNYGYGFGLATKDNLTDEAQDYLIYANLPLYTVPQANFKIDFELFIKEKNPNIIFKNKSNGEFYKWNHDGSDIIQI